MLHVCFYMYAGVFNRSEMRLHMQIENIRGPAIAILQGFRFRKPEINIRIQFVERFLEFYSRKFTLAHGSLMSVPCMPCMHTIINFSRTTGR